MDQALSMAPRAGDPLFLGTPPAPEVRRQLQALSRIAEPARAESLLREALELDPYCMDTYHAFCRLFVRQGRWTEAENAALAALGVVGGESGVAGLAGLRIAATDRAMRAALGLDASSRVLLFGTEGATDPALYEELVGESAERVMERAAT